MPGKIIKLAPNVTPNQYYEANKEWLGIVPDGAGLQILFEINDEFYVFAGPRGGKVLTVNGGKVDDAEAPFLTQLSEELFEETFGMMNVVKADDGYKLLIKGSDVAHKLDLLEDHSFVMYKPAKYAYATFTAVCKTLTLAQLNQLAERLTPTARFWNQFGNFLFAQTQKAPKEDEAFLEYWKINAAARAEFLENMAKNYAIMSEEDTLIVTPLDVFAEDTIEKALNKMNNVHNFKALDKMFRHTVGRYSERSSYEIFSAEEVLNAAINKSSVKNVHDDVVAAGVFNDDVVVAVLPTLGVKIQAKEMEESVLVAPKLVVEVDKAPVSLSPHNSLFKPAPAASTSEVSLNASNHVSLP